MRLQHHWREIVFVPSNNGHAIHPNIKTHCYFINQQISQANIFELATTTTQNLRSLN